jgi:hypothetical protein
MSMLGLKTVLRMREFFALRWEDVVLKARRLVVKRAVARGVVGSTKSGRNREHRKGHSWATGPAVISDGVETNNQNSGGAGSRSLRRCLSSTATWHVFCAGSWRYLGDADAQGSPVRSWVCPVDYSSPAGTGVKTIRTTASRSACAIRRVPWRRRSVISSRVRYRSATPSMVRSR